MSLGALPLKPLIFVDVSLGKQEPTLGFSIGMQFCYRSPLICSIHLNGADRIPGFSFANAGRLP